jgi:dolichyl-phosphate-mannose-protein mannosyltransferase
MVLARVQRQCFATVRAGYRMLQARVDRALDPGCRGQTLITAAAVLMLALGIYWRFADLAYPPFFMFDEHHFVENARNYFRHNPDWNDHPPLGKLLIVPGMVFLGDNGAGWRIHEAVLGSVHLGLVYVLARRLFRDARTGLLAAAFVATDGIFVSYSRTALPDIPMNVFVLAALVALLEVRGRGGLAAAGLSLGLAVSVKWIAVCAAPLLPLILWRRGVRSWLAIGACCMWMGCVVVLTYVGIWALALALTRHPFTVDGMIARNLELLRSHAGFTDWKNPADSRWYTWPLLWRPVTLHHADIADGYRRVTSTVGNPLVWYATTAAFALALGDLARALWARVARREHFPSVLATRAFLLLAAVSLMVQWMLTNRESYIWHYMGSYTMGIILLADRVSWFGRREPLAVALVVLLVGAVAIFYAPVWTNGCLATTAVRWRLFAPGWRWW